MSHVELSLGEVRKTYALYKRDSHGCHPFYKERLERFDRWLDEHERQVAERAWDEGLRAGRSAPLVHLHPPFNPYRKGVAE